MSEIKKNPVGRPPVNATPITVRVPPDMLAAVDNFVDERAGITRPEAVRLILKRWLTDNQMLPKDDGKDSLGR